MRIVEVCCFKEDRYRWFRLPHPMTKAEAERWALDAVGTPAENFRYVFLDDQVYTQPKQEFNDHGDGQ